MLKLNVFKSACIPAPPDLNTLYVKAKQIKTICKYSLVKYLNTSYVKAKQETKSNLELFAEFKYILY